MFFNKNYDKLMSGQTNKKKIKKYHCRTCSRGFQSEGLLKKHEKQGCLAVEGQKIEKCWGDYSIPKPFQDTTSSLRNLR